MSKTQVPIGTTEGFAPPIVTQFAVFLDNRVGKMRDLAEIFEGHHLKLCALSVVDAVSYAVIRVVTSNSTLARRLLTRHGFHFSEVDILAVEMRDEHSLSQICQFLTAVEVNIHYIYPLWVQPRGAPVIALYADDITFASQILRRRLVTLLGENDLGENAPQTQVGTPNDPSAVDGGYVIGPINEPISETDSDDVDEAIDELFNGPGTKDPDDEQDDDDEDDREIA